MPTDASILINGDAATQISVADRGLLYGDGVFETMAWDGQSIRFFEHHLARLTRGCEVLGLALPARTVLKNEIDRVAGGQARCVIKVMITRGVGGWGYTPAGSSGRAAVGHTTGPAAVPTRIVQRLPYPAHGNPSRELHCAVLTTVLGANRQLAGIKHLNRLEQVLAAREVAERGLDEGILCNADGFVMEAVSANLLLVFGERLVTPRLDTGGVHGVMREVLIERLQSQGIEVHKEYVYVDTLAGADEIILCNSIRGVRAVAKLDDTVFVQRDYLQRLMQLIDESG